MGKGKPSLHHYGAELGVNTEGLFVRPQPGNSSEHLWSLSLVQGREPGHGNGTLEDAGSGAVGLSSTRCCCAGTSHAPSWGDLGWWEELSTMLKGAGIPEGVEGTSQRIGNVCRAPLQAHLWGGAVSSMEGALKRSFSFGFGLEVICSAKLFCSASRRRVEKQGREGKAWDDS